MELALYQVDAFSSRLFGGNPAAVVPLEQWLPDEAMQNIAAENHLSETAFYVPSKAGRYGLRWFTPAVEVPLCGHATLGTAYVMFEMRKELTGNRVEFESRESGILTVERGEDGLLELDFPARPATPADRDPALVEALGAEPAEFHQSAYCMVVFENQDQLRRLRPHMQKVIDTGYWGVIGTAPGSDCDFVSRFFAPAKGVDEDPVTGSAHTILIPYWSKRLGRRELFARQISQRGGELWCTDAGDRVKIGGRVTPYLTGTIRI